MSQWLFWSITRSWFLHNNTITCWTVWSLVLNELGLLKEMVGSLGSFLVSVPAQAPMIISQNNNLVYPGTMLRFKVTMIKNPNNITSSYFLLPSIDFCHSSWSFQKTNQGKCFLKQFPMVHSIDYLSVASSTPGILLSQPICWNLLVSFLFGCWGLSLRIFLLNQPLRHLSKYLYLYSLA